MHLVGFIIRVYHDARSPERQMWSNSVYELSIKTFKEVITVSKLYENVKNLCFLLNYLPWILTYTNIIYFLLIEWRENLKTRQLLETDSGAADFSVLFGDVQPRGWPTFRYDIVVLSSRDLYIHIYGHYPGEGAQRPRTRKYTCNLPWSGRCCW